MKGVSVFPCPLAINIHMKGFVDEYSIVMSFPFLPYRYGLRVRDLGHALSMYLLGLGPGGGKIYTVKRFWNGIILC